MSKYEIAKVDDRIAAMLPLSQTDPQRRAIVYYPCHLSQDDTREIVTMLREMAAELEANGKEAAAIAAQMRRRK